VAKNAGIRATGILNRICKDRQVSEDAAGINGAGDALGVVG
jgi:hypothetical protein